MPYFVDNRIGLSAEWKTFLRNKLFPDVFQYFASTLSIKPVQGKFAIDACFTKWSSSRSVAGHCRILKSIHCGPKYNYDNVFEQHFRPVTYCNRDSAASCKSYGGGGVAETDFLLYIYATSEGITIFGVSST